MTESALTVSAVDDEINSAKSEVSDLEQRVIDGDTKVTSSMISKAREKLEFLGLRRKAAVKAELDESEAQLNHAAEQWRSECQELRQRDISVLRKAYEEVVVNTGVLQRLLREYEAREHALTAQAARLRQGDPQIPKLGVSLIDTAIHEGRGGTVPSAIADHSLRIFGHTLHSDERREEIRSDAQSVAIRRHGERVSQRIAELTATPAEQTEA